MSFVSSPRALAVRTLIPIEVTPRELHRLVRILEDEAVRAANDPDQEGYADFLFERVAVIPADVLQ